MNISEGLTATPGYIALMARLQPLIDGGRLDNIVDLLSLLSDLVDLLDEAMVEKLALLFEQAAASSWAATNTLRLARAETVMQAKSPSLYTLLKLLNDRDTRKGVAIVLKTLNVIGRQL
ncbi:MULTISPECIES: DUF1641 domain-containing protein [unclassified Pseudomonas]|uniref:DUF1641 domain-containing protein n=1 Tax=unclassified Pseudomonas TaxID=196821 RepID=UPI00117B5E59|nr:MULTISPECIES: DUF1641 domain-containing protein [unclassified Pseudomonas]